MPNRELFLKTTVAAGYVGQLVQRHLDPVGIPAYLLALVTHVRDHQPVTPSGIAAASGVPLTTLRDNIQRLVDRGLARRIPNPDDARSYLLELTPAGLALTKAADPALAERLRRGRGAPAATAGRVRAHGRRAQRGARRRARSALRRPAERYCGAERSDDHGTRLPARAQRAVPSTGAETYSPRPTASG